MLQKEPNFLPVISFVSQFFSRLIKMHLENFSFVHIRVEQKLFLVVKIQSACWGCIDIEVVDVVPVPGGVLHVDGVGVGEHDVHLGPHQLGLTHVVLQLVAFNTTASVISILVVVINVFTFLITEAPLLALIPIWKVNIWTKILRSKLVSNSPMQDLLSLPTFMPVGQIQVPPSSELLHEYWHPRLEHRFLAEITIE